MFRIAGFTTLCHDFLKGQLEAELDDFLKISGFILYQYSSVSKGDLTFNSLRSC